MSDFATRHLVRAAFHACGLAVAAAVLGLAPVLAAGPGDLVKLESDLNPATQRDSAVYYVGADGKRYVFPNFKTYDTWYDGYDSVSVISEEEMAALPIGGNVTYRPGTRLVKVVSDPTVYAVEPGGVLRAVVSETVARSLYGENWADRVDDVPDAFFVNYTVGEPVTSALWPTGTVVRQSGDGRMFYIEGGAKRIISEPGLLSELGLREEFVVVSSSSLFVYPDGAPLTSSEPAVTDTSGRNSELPVSLPRLSLRALPSSYIATDSDVTLAELHISADSDVWLTGIRVWFEALTNRGGDDVDDDLGGLVYDNNKQTNFRLIRFEDSSGDMPFGWKELRLDVSQDQGQSLSFAGSYLVRGGTEQTLYLRAQVSSLLPKNETYRVTFPADGIRLFTDRGESSVFLPTMDLRGQVLTTFDSRLTVVPATALGNKTCIRGARRMPVSGFTFRATAAAENVIRSVVFQGYINENEGGSGGFLPGLDTDNGTTTYVRDLVTGLYLYDADGNELAGPVQVSHDGRATFDDLELSIPPGGQLTVGVRADISPTVYLEQNPDYISFDIDNPSIDIEVTDQNGFAISATGSNPNLGVTPLMKLTVKDRGTADFSWLSSADNKLAGTDTLMGTLRIEAEDDTFRLNTLTLVQPNGAAQSLGGMRVEYVNSAKQTVSKSADFVGSYITFSGLDAPFSGERTDIKVYGSLKSRSGGAVYGEDIRMAFNESGPFEFRSATSGELFDESDLGGPDFSLVENRVSSSRVRYSKLTAALAPDSPTGDLYRGPDQPILKYYLTADPAGAVRVRKFAFKLDPSDAGRTGADNDSLEYWADLDGDFPDDDRMVSLYTVASDGVRTLIGEGSNAKISYSIMHEGTIDETPAGLNSSGYDYGIVTYEFAVGSEMYIPAGGTTVFLLEADMSGFPSQNNYPIEVRFLSDYSIVWTDIPSGTYTPRYGFEVPGSGFYSPRLIVRQ